MSLVTLVCAGCGAEFRTFDPDNRTHCSAQCRADHHVTTRRWETRVCAREGCGRAYQSQKSSQQRYCGHDCRSAGARLARKAVAS